MAKKEKPKNGEDLYKLRLPSTPRPEPQPERTDETHTEVIEEMKQDPEEEAKTETKNQQSGWKLEDVEALLKLAMEFLGTNLADKYITYKKNDAEAKRHYFESVSTHNRKMIYILIAFLTGVVAFTSCLTIFDKVSGDALLFLVGTITGYIIISIQRLVFPSEEPPAIEQ